MRLEPQGKQVIGRLAITKVSDLIESPDPTRGVTKFVLRPVCPREVWLSQVERLAREIIRPVQTPFSQQELRERSGFAVT